MEQKLNKKGLTPRNWIIIGILMSVIFVASSVWINAWSPIYYQNDTAGSLDSYNYISNLSEKTNTLQGTLSADSSSVTIGYLDFVIKGAYNVLNAVTSIPGIFVGLIRDVGATYGINEMYINAAITLIAVALIFGIVGVIFRRRT